MRNCVLLFVLLCTGFSTFAQILPAGTPFFEERWRMLQLKGEKDINASFCIRPFITLNDSVYTACSPALAKISHIKWLPITSTQQFNAHNPYGWNNGSMIPAKGYQHKLTGGVYGRWGMLSVQLQPELVYAQNSDFRKFSPYHTDSVWATYYNTVLNVIDNPERFDNGSYTKVFPGQSSVRLHYKKLSLGVSTENLWWGPGVRNSLLMSNNAPGFGHLTFNTTEPVKSPIGSFEWQLVAGLLNGSGILPPDTGRTWEGQRLYNPKPGGDRYLNGMVITWQPKWAKGLHLGFSRVFYQYSNNVESSLNGWLPAFGSFFKGNSRDENSFGRDQMLSLFFRFVFPNDNAEVYVEYGRNDHSQNIDDLAMEPEHARAYIVGGKKLFKNAKGADIELMVEVTQLQNPSTNWLRESPTWYTHHQVRHGYTSHGQIIGAGIGPGSNSQVIGLKWYKENRQYGRSFERVVRNNNFYYALFAGENNFGSHWVDLSLNGHYSVASKRFVYSGNLSYIYTYNYEWKYDNGDPALQNEGPTNVHNLHASLSVSYLF
ncbi:MAG: capsule assembly Wzi family protein [Agriterribacter sp.]